MSAIWAEDRKLAAWQEVETLATEGWASLGVVPSEVAEAIRAATPVTASEVREREEITNHDVAAFVDVLASRMGTGDEWVHFGLTSSDVLDTAGGVLLRDAADLLLKRIADLFDVVRRRAFEHRDTVMVGRTHGIWAEPTTFGLKLANWAFEVARGHDRMKAARSAVAVGKISGAVGTYAHVPPELESHICEQLGIGVEPASTQVTARDRHAQFVQAIALTGASLERFATEIRHLQRSEVGEAREAFSAGQKGSSSMPHKRNPIMSERVTGMARLLRGYAQAATENVALWHERDISHSSAERVLLPDSCLALDYMLVKFTGVVDGLVVNTKAMDANLEATHGLVYSQAVLVALIRTGLGRDDAYRMIQGHSMRAWDEGVPLYELLLSDPAQPLDAATLEACFDPKRFLERSSVVFERLEHLSLK